MKRLLLNCCQDACRTDQKCPYLSIYAKPANWSFRNGHSESINVKLAVSISKKDFYFLVMAVSFYETSESEEKTKLISKYKKLIFTEGC